MAHVIARTGRPAIILAPNKTLAAQLYGEMKSFFPENAVEYFVSYYDYYQPEAYVPRTDTYVEKESSLNEQIDRMRHSATRAILERRDVVVVASVSCIYGIGSVETYSQMTESLAKSATASTATSCCRTSSNCNTGATTTISSAAVSGCAATRSNCSRRITRTAPGGSRCSATRSRRSTRSIPLTGEKTAALQFDQGLRQQPLRDAAPDAVAGDRADQARPQDPPRGTAPRRQAPGSAAARTAHQLRCRNDRGDRLLRRHRELFALSDRPGRPGEPPPTFFEYMSRDALVIVDESHVTVPQLGGMFGGDWTRKTCLAEYGFRLPSCTDNRPLNSRNGTRCAARRCSSRRPRGRWEMERAGGVFVEQIVRPTGLVDPPCIIRADREPGRRSDGRVPRRRRQGPARAGHDADQEDGRGADRIPARSGAAGALHAFRCRHDRAHRDHPRSAARRLRRADRDQPVARGARHPGMRAGRGARRRQGRAICARAPR